VRSAEVMPVPKRKKIQAPAVATTKVPKPDGAGKVGLKASKQLATIAENSEGDSEPLLSKKSEMMSRKRGMIMEDTDSDGIELPSKSWKLKRKGKATVAVNEEATTAESNMDLPPPKRPKVTKKAIGRDMMEKSGRKKKESVHEAIATIQREQMAAIMQLDSNSSGASEEWGEAAAVKDKAQEVVKDVPKHFSNGPQWNR
jgi:hypothetical protein